MGMHVWGGLEVLDLLLCHKDMPAFLYLETERNDPTFRHTLGSLLCNPPS